MHEELTFDSTGTATIRLSNGSWATYIQHVCDRLRAAGQRHQHDGRHTLLTRLKLRRPSTYAHSVRVAKMAHTTGHAFGFDDERMKQLSYAALFHDLGKILVPERVLNRPRRLTRSEKFLLNLHPSFGALLATYFNLPAELRVRTEHHHERWDGNGYPHGLGGEDIPQMARIVQVADAFDAMVARRPYCAPRDSCDALAELRQHSGKQFDPRVVEAFLDTYTVSCAA